MTMADLYEYSTPEIVRLMGTRFKDYRMRCGLTQKDVAERSGIGLTTIHKFESGVADNLTLSTPDFDNDSPNSLTRVRDPFN